MQNSDFKYYKFNNTITVNFGSKTITIHRDDPRFDKVSLAIEENRLSDIPKLADNESSEHIRHLLKLGTKREKKT